MEFDHSKLNGRIVEKYGSRAAFAEAAGLKQGQLSRRLNNQTPLSDAEIYTFCRMLDIPGAKVDVYFFTPKVR